ncbi:hypothetical protein QYM36_006223, partial [Artemia franciscana]
MVQSTKKLPCPCTQDNSQDGAGTWCSCNAASTYQSGHYADYNSPTSISSSSAQSYTHASDRSNETIDVPSDDEDLSSDDSSDESETTNSSDDEAVDSSDESEESIEGLPGSYYCGYGRCYSC